MAMNARAIPDCPLTAALELIGGRWHLIVLYALAQQPRRFNELQRLAPGVSHKVLTETVRHLQAAGLIDREVGAGAAPYVRYSLSEVGESVRPILDTIVQWGNARLAAQTAGNSARPTSG
jgi:DNA-binding HxlR family transcriptional regulator